MSSPVLLGQSLEQLTDWVAAHGQPKYRGKQLYQWLYHKGARDWEVMSVFPKQWRQEMADYPLGRSQIYHQTIAQDETRKYLLKLQDGLIIETVGIPTDKRLTVCVSSQVGCAMACDFCATGKSGFTRNLQAYEIVDQVLTVQEDFKRRVSNIVFMGMGEPLANLTEVTKAVQCLNRDVGIGARSITVSTVGLPHKIKELSDYQLAITLAVSIHAPNQPLREKLIPTAHHYAIAELIQDCREYVQVTGRRVTFEYIVLAGVNDQLSHAKELAQLLKGWQNHVNLIPYNPINEVDYQRPSEVDLDRFQALLRDRNVAVSVRRSRGLDQDAACGQLRSTVLNSQEEP